MTVRSTCSIRAAQLLGGLEPGEVDGTLESHVDRNRPFDDIPMAAGKPEACSLLLMLVRRGGGSPPAADGANRLGPFVCRARRPYMLAWSDHGAERQGTHDGRFAGTR